MDRVTGRICEEIDPESPVQLANEFVRFARAEDVAAEDPWTLGPYALANRFSFVFMKAARPAT
jgi:hypothetical protein